MAEAVETKVATGTPEPNLEEDHDVDQELFECAYCGAKIVGISKCEVHLKTVHFSHLYHRDHPYTDNNLRLTVKIEPELEPADKKDDTVTVAPPPKYWCTLCGTLLYTNIGRLAHWRRAHESEKCSDKQG